jgi:monoamine oxidase
LKRLTDVDVVIIGAGAAGLAALQVLDRAGLRVILLEARDRVGGRILTIHDPLSSVPLELGAEFIHGRPPELWEIIRTASLPVYDGTDNSRYVNNGAVERNADAWVMLHSLMQDMQAAANGPDQSFEEFLSQAAYDEETKRAARGYVEGFNAAESYRISIQALAEETAAADQIDGHLIFRFASGYDAAPLYLLKSVPAFQEKLRLNTVVERVDWNPGSVRVHTNRDEVWQAKQAIVTVPLGVLQSGNLAFSPEPLDTLQAVRSLCSGQVYRVVLRFREPIWEHQEDLKDVGFILSNEDLFPTWWTTLAMRSSIITGWSAGTHANALQGRSRDEILTQALSSLARITGLSPELIHSQLEAMYFHDWQADPYALGAYSYVPSGALAARKQLAIPVANTLYFAGEATDQGGHSATVHGAIASGRRAAQQLRSVKSRHPLGRKPRS